MPSADSICGSANGASLSLSLRDDAVYGAELGHFTLRIGNYRAIRRAYSEDTALEVLDQLVNRINQVIQGGGVATPAAYGEVMVSLTNLTTLQVEATPQACRTWLWALCAAMSSMPIDAARSRADGTTCPVFPLLSGDWDKLPEGELAEELRSVDPWHMADPAADALHGKGPAWAESYRSDMALAAEALAAFAPAELYRPDRASQLLLLLWQPVCDAANPDDVLYYEALLRFVDGHGVWRAPTPSLLALEKLGLVNLLDHHVVSRVLAALEEDPDVKLAVNISARSARSDPWWHDVIARLRASPSVVRRLTIEITETAALPNIANAVRFVEDLRRLGCKIAIDDFGAGFTSVRHLLALAPDVVKIDRCFIVQSELSQRGAEIFRSLVQLVRSFGATIVIEGVETQAQADFAFEAGGRWQQGYLWGRPTASQAWRVSSPGNKPYLRVIESAAGADAQDAALARRCGQ